MTLTRTTKLLTAALAVITLGLGTIAMAQPGGPGSPGGRRGHGGPGGFGPGGPGGPGFPALRQLDLSDAQREQVKGIFDQHKEEFTAIGERLRTARNAQVAAIETQPVDEATIRAKTTDLAAVEADAAVLRAKVHAAVFQVLTPEQQEKAKTLKADMEQRRGEMRERSQERRQQRQQKRQANPPAAQF